MKAKVSGSMNRIGLRLGFAAAPACLLITALALSASTTGCGSGSSYTLSVPNIANLSPAQLPKGSPAQTLTINGVNFLASSTVSFNGSARTASFVNSKQLTIPLATSDLTQAATMSVVVSNPGQGGGVSPAASFVVTATSIPPAAASAGYYANTFDSASFSSSNVDLKNTYAAGFQWYGFDLFGNPDDSKTVINSDGSITVQSTYNNGNGNISTAAVPGTTNIVGTAFGGGGYFEAEIKFDPSTVTYSNGWPSFWALPAEKLTWPVQPSVQWPGQPSGYFDYIETDVMEYNQASPGGQPINAYLATVHDWYGIGGVTCTSSYYCDLSNEVVPYVPNDSSMTGYHKYGMLWIPATDTDQGSIAYYVDGQQVANTTYSKFDITTATPPPTAPSAFGVIDNEHLVFILGTGTSSPMTVKSVTAWQKDASQNITSF